MSKPYLVIIHGFLQRFHCFPEFIKDMEKNLMFYLLIYQDMEKTIILIYFALINI